MERRATDESAFLERIARRHGLIPPTSWPAPWIGATSRVWPCGDEVIKVAFDSPEAARAVIIDATINPAARDLGVRTPALRALDDRHEIVPVTYAIYDRVRDAMPLGDVSGPDHLIRQAWEDVGRNLALVHAVAWGTSMSLQLREFRQHPGVDPRPWVEDLAGRDRLASADASWLHRVLDILASDALADIPLVLCHGDVNASNILLTRGAGPQVALIDWSGAGWLDPAWDFAVVPFRAIPHLLAGHREVAPLPSDDTAEARILWCQLQMRLLNARTEPDGDLARMRLTEDLEAARSFAALFDWV